VRACAVDANQAAIVAALRAIGCRVFIASSFGKGFPDLVVAHPATGITLLEVKDGDKPPSARKLTKDQQVFHREWAGFRVYVICTVDEAIRQVSGS